MDWAKHPKIRRAARAMARGGVIAYPTEAVWGLGCDPQQRQAVERLLRLKRRPVGKGVILVASSMAQLQPFLSRLTAEQMDTLAASWPGPVTWLVPDNGRVPPWIRGRHRSVALRVSVHPVVSGLCRAFGGPVVSTSANRAGMREARDALSVRRQFGRRLAAVTPGQVGDAARPTEIRDLLTGETLRSG